MEDSHGGDGESYVLASRETRRTSRVVDKGITNIKPPLLLVRVDREDWISRLDVFFSPPSEFHLIAPTKRAQQQTDTSESGRAS